MGSGTRNGKEMMGRYQRDKRKVRQKKGKTCGQGAAMSFGGVWERQSQIQKTKHRVDPRLALGCALL